MERLYWLTEGWYWNISLLPVLHTDSLNSLVVALRKVFTLKEKWPTVGLQVCQLSYNLAEL